MIPSETLLGVAILTGITTATLTLFRIPRPWEPLVAIARATAQLAIISLILGEVITSPGWIALALVVMFAVASVVATRRIGWSGRGLAGFATSIAAGASVAVVTVFASGALELTPRYALATGAMVLGNAMSVATLTGRTLRRRVAEGWDQVEGWLALGATPRQATWPLARESVREALIPAVDQTKTTGLVVLPGAFVGAIFGGLSPLEAARFQIVVLSAVLAAGAITAMCVVGWLGAVARRPVAPG